MKESHSCFKCGVKEHLAHDCQQVHHQGPVVHDQNIPCGQSCGRGRAERRDHGPDGAQNQDGPPDLDQLIGKNGKVICFIHFDHVNVMIMMIILILSVGGLCFNHLLVAVLDSIFIIGY